MIKAIITGDDFGMSPAINEGIRRAHTQGCLTSASLSVAGSAVEEAVEIARALPNLGIGLHLTLVNEHPLSPPEQIPSLLAQNGRLLAGPFAFARRWLSGRIEVEQIRREVRAQLLRGSELGLTITHLDGEDHLHVFPGVAEIVFEEMVAFGIQRVRIPLDIGSSKSIRWKRYVLRFVLNFAARRAGKLAEELGIRFPKHFIGFLDVGRMDEKALLAYIQTLGEGITEISLHPAADSGYLQREFGNWEYHSSDELEVLMAPRVREAIDSRNIMLIHYGQIPL